MVTKIKREINWNKYLGVSAVTALVFILGILAGNYIASSKLGELERTQQDLIAQSMGLELKDALFQQNNICELTWREIWEEKVAMGTQIEQLEIRFGKEDKRVIQQKEIYQLIEIRTWLLLKEIKEKCDSNFNIVLYFYTNKENDKKGSWKDCENQGYVISALYQSYSNTTNIFAFDINTENPATLIMQHIYNITEAPSIIINDNLYSGFKSLNELKEILGYK